MKLEVKFKQGKVEHLTKLNVRLYQPMERLEKQLVPKKMVLLKTFL